ncbi:MAG: FAD-dependent oxidoreductase [Candidatus Sungbacteria bacterium]|nr:FAD-dependent oxidoreductase [Candidatus Sungbacteria bacterium]
MTDRDSEKKHIIIVGAGFGGLRTALTLARHAPRKTEYEIILVDRHRHHIYTPALYEVAAIPREYFNDKSLVSSILIPISEIIQGLPIRFIPDEVIGHDAADQSLILRDCGKLPYEYLVLALGSETNYFNIPGLAEASLPLKTCDDASLLRNKIETALKEKPSLKIVVGGAGASGVELIAELVNFFNPRPDQIPVAIQRSLFAPRIELDFKIVVFPNSPQ